MDPISAAIGAGGSILGSVLGFSSANRQMDFQRELSNTQYRRAVRDLKMAGLNPMLAYTQGGASTPGGASATFDNIGEAAMHSAKQGEEINVAKQQAEQIDAQTDLLKAQTAKTQSETMDIAVNSAEQAARINLTEGQEKQIRALARKTEGEVVGAHADSASKEAMLSHMSKGGGAGFEADVRRRKAEALLMELGIPGAQAESMFYSSEFGKLNPYLRQLIMIARGVFNAKPMVGGKR